MYFERIRNARDRGQKHTWVCEIIYDRNYEKLNWPIIKPINDQLMKPFKIDEVMPKKWKRSKYITD